MSIQWLRRKLFSVSLLVWCACVALPVKSQDEQSLSLSLDDAKRIALSENPMMRIAGQEIELKKVADKEAWQSLLPSANLTGSYSYAIKKQTMVVQGTPMSFGSDNTYSGGIAVNLPLYVPALYQTMRMSKDDIALAVEKSRGSKHDLINQVTKAYYQLLLAQDSYWVMKKSYDQGLANYHIVDAKFNQGRVSEYEKIRAEVQANSLKPNVVNAKNAIELAKLQLKVLLALDYKYELEIVGTLADFEERLFMERVNPDRILLNQNSDLRQLDLSRTLLSHALKLQKTNFLPTLSAAFSYNYISLNNDFRIMHYRWFPYSTVGVNLNIPLFTASHFTGVKKVKIQQKQLVEQRRNLTRQLAMQIESCQNSMEASTEQLVTAKQNVGQAQKGRDISLKRYEVGAGTLLELNDAEVALTQAELSYNQALYDYLTARADLEKVLGQE